MRMLFISTVSETLYQFALPFAKYMRAKGHDISFACSLQGFPDAPCRVKNIEDEGFIVYGIPFIREIKLWPWQDLKAFWRLFELLKRHNYDLVHTHASKAGFIGRLAAWLVGCPRIIHTPHHFKFQSLPPGWKRQFYIFLEKKIAAFCHYILFVSEFTRQEAINFRIKEEESLIFVSNGIDISKFAQFCSDRNAVRRQYIINNEDFVIGAVGRLVKTKGIDTLIRAAAIVLKNNSNVHFIIAGAGELRSELEQLAKSLGIRENIQFTGYIPNNEDIMKLMASLDLFVLPTRCEGLGIVYLEAMALGCPVIGSKISPITEVIQEGETGLLATVDDPEDFARAILQLLEQPAIRQKMSERGFTYVEKKFSLEQSFKRIEDVYSHLI